MPPEMGSARTHLDGVAQLGLHPGRHRGGRRRGPGHLGGGGAAVSRFEPVTVVVDPGDVEVAAGRWPPGHSDVELLEAPLDDAWMRDIGPTFVVGRDGRARRPSTGSSTAGAHRPGPRGTRTRGSARSSPDGPGRRGSRLDLVNEGGGIHVDGHGTVLLTETVQLDPGRNPGLTRAEVEAELSRTIGATTCIWLPRGLTRDYDEFGTRGHVDIVATFASPGVVLLHGSPTPPTPTTR